MIIEQKLASFVILLFSFAIFVEPTIVYAGREENEQDDKLYIDELCDASEDYEANKNECDKLYDALEKDAKDDINSFEDGVFSKEIDNDECEEEYGDLVDGKCDLDEEQY